MTSAHQNLAWLISDFARTADGVTHAVAVSSDGLLIAASDGLSRDLADRLSALVSGIVSLTQNAADTYGFRGMKLVMIEMLDGFMMVNHMRDGSCLGALAGEGCDIGLVGYEMAVLADRAGALLTPQLIGRPHPSPFVR
ncbi:roadblock/LC7 domain-containing protein [Streptomyces sp. NBC_01235]|uniref:roadblock/LC7 domain-containing protein n=1 Tax=Streptomyces sp. NBC_01235 TaxID=2903788 RepID=UPI002E0D36F9|nr:roadblock/LC7 domain-containing protein [Streptomyces sp. NBC_01235]